MTQAYDILEASGLDPAEFELTAHADVVPRENDADLPAIIAGRYRSHNAVIRAWPVVVDDAGHVVRWDALAFVSAHPGFALNELSTEERERLRAESQTPQGAPAPVGQERVIGRSTPVPAPPPDPKPYTPPVQPLDGQVTAEEPVPESEVTVEEADCGYAGCVKLTGPEGVQVNHVEGCVQFGGS